MSTPTAGPSRILAALTLGLVTAAGALAQDSPTTRKKPAAKPNTDRQPANANPAAKQPGDKPAKPGTGAAATKLADEAMRIEAVGLSFYPPESSRAETTSLGGQSSVSVKGSDGSWVVNILTPRTSDPGTSAADVCTEAIKQITAAAGSVYQEGNLIGNKGRIIARDEKLVINGAPAERFYLEVPQPNKDPSLVRGYTVFKVGNDRFTIFDLTTTLKDFEKVRGVYETLVGTAKFENAGELAAARGAAVSAGIKLMEGMSDQTLRDLVAASPERWERLYKPGTTGAASDDTEIAYRRIRCWTGKRGELNTSRKPEQFRGVETEEGVLVRIDARQLADGRVFDSQGIYFVTFDRSEESWTLSNNVREGNTRSVATETGARNGKQMTVSTVVSGFPDQTIRPVIQGDGYVSRVESFLLPQLLVRSAIPTDYGFYVYQSDTASIRLRRDDLEQPADRPDLWKLSTKLKEEAKPMVSLFNAKGELIRTDMPDGSRWEPTKLDDLIKLWKSKNLPLD